MIYSCKMMDSDLNKVFSRCEGTRIAYYRRNFSHGENFWDEHWQDNISKEYYRPYLKGYLGHGQVKNVFLKFLPRHGLILEAGCGTARYVIALRARGYNCLGIDYAVNTIERVKNYFPGLPVESGNICQLNFQNESVNAYISLGVMEHFREGPQKAIREASRILKKEGVMLISVPQVFNWRKMRAQPEDAPLPENASFYQYAYSAQEFRSHLSCAGFKIQAEYGYHSHYALMMRFNFVQKALKILPWLAFLDLIIDKTPIGRDVSRMRLYVARKI